MTEWRSAIHSFLESKTDFTVINAMKQYSEPSTYVSYYALDEDTESTTRGIRDHNATTDALDIFYSPITLVTLQIDVRGDGSFTESKELFFGFQAWQNELKALGIFYRGIGSISPIPTVQNGYIKEGYQFNLFFSYDTTIVSEVQYAEEITIYGN